MTHCYCGWHSQFSVFREIFYLCNGRGFPRPTHTPPAVMSREGKKFPEIQVYPQPPSAYKIIEPYVDFVADLEADKVRSEIMQAEGTQLRSQTTPSKSRKQQSPHHAPIPLRSQTATAKSPRNLRTAPASTDSQLVRESLMSVKKNSQPNVLLGPPFPPLLLTLL
jgi:hypothetical protein